VSLQASSQSKERWKKKVTEAARRQQQESYELGFLDNRALAVTIYFIASDPMEGDIDNIVKPIMDSLIGVVERVVVQKFEPEGGWNFSNPSDRLSAALDKQPPVVYVCVDDDLSWRKL
jgi:hypothetical protein